MKRPIIPVNIPLSNKLISTPRDIQELYEKDIEVFSVLFHNGDIARILHTFSKEYNFNRDSILEIEKLNYLEHHDDAFTEDNKHSLLAKKYTSLKRSIDTPLVVNGYHKHRTLINCNNNIVNINENCIISNLLLKNTTFIIKENVLFSLNSLMLDNVKVILNYKSEISINDVEFSNCDDYCIFLKKTSKVVEFKNVRFFDVKKRFYMEYANNYMHSALLNFNDADEIIDFLSLSTIVKIELINDFVVTVTNLNFNQNVEFVNGTDKDLVFDAPNIILNNDFVLNDTFVNRANYAIVEMDSIKVSLSNFSGKLTVTDSDDIKLFNTLLKEVSPKSMEFIKSNIQISNILIDSCVEPIGMYGSLVKIEATTIKNTAACFSEAIYRLDEDETLYEEEVAGNEVQIKGSEIISSTLLGNVFFEKITLARMKLNNISTLINTDNTILNITQVESENVDSIASLNNSDVKVSDSNFIGGDQAFVLFNTIAHINNISISKYNRGLKQKDGVAQIYSTVFDSCRIGVELNGENGLIKHHSVKFINTLERKLLVTNGSKVINIEEYEGDEELCQIN